VLLPAVASPRATLFASCGDDRDRTGNLRLAKPALSQLSYVPVRASDRCWAEPPPDLLATLGALGFEPRTSALSELRSSQLSYAPGRTDPACDRNKKAKPKQVWLYSADLGE
jgi:hypothetical protein